LREHLARWGIRLLQRESIDIEGHDGTRLRLHGAVRWSDFDLFGADMRPRAERVAAYFQRKMAATRDGRAFDTAAVRDEGLACRVWLETVLAVPARVGVQTVVVTHFGPSLKSVDPRYGSQPGTAAICTAGTTTACPAPGAARRGWSATRAAWRPSASTRATSGR
jgi:hypothetical protein